MNARLVANLINAGLGQATKPAQIVGNPVKIGKPQFGKPDKDLARVVCRAIVDAVPPTVIEFNPIKHARLRRELRAHGIAC